MNLKNCSFFTLLVSAMLLLSFSSLSANVTVTYNNELTPGFPYNTAGNVISVDVLVTGTPVAAFDLISKIKTTVTSAFGTVTAVDVSAVTGGGYDVSEVNGTSEDRVRLYGYNCGANVMAPGTYTFTLTVTTSFDTGRFVIEDGGQWIVDPDPVIASTSFIQQGATPATTTLNPGIYRVFNTAPDITNCPGAGLIFNACNPNVDYDFDGVDPDNFVNPPVWTRPGGTAGGVINASTGFFHWDPPAVAGVCGMYDLTVRLTDEWGAFDECTVTFTLVTDAPTFTACPTPGSETVIYWGWTADGDVDADDPDDCPVALTYTLVNFSGPGTFTVDPVTGVWDWPTVFGDNSYLGTHTVEISVFDGCEYDYCTFTIHVIPTFEVQIAKVHDVHQGHVVSVPINLLHWTEGFGGYDFLISYDASALVFLSAMPGEVLTNCGFEFFTWRFGPFGNCNGPCPSGFVRIVSIADANNGPNHPSCYGEGVIGALAYLKFLVTNDRTYECQKVDVTFYWFDCGDNGISSISGDTLHLSAHVYGYDLVGELTGLPGYGGWQGLGVNCLLGDKYYPDTVINFFNGGVDIICADSIDKRGDLNLNGIVNEIADAVLYTNYFIYGLGVFDIALAGQVAASDVNNDGLTLSVGDLVYLIRIITGDEFPYAKLSPFSTDADLHVVNGKITTSSTDRIGALYMTFKADADYSVVNHSSMEVLQGEHDGLVHVLIYSGMNNMTNAIPVGNNELLTITGAELVNVQASDYYGNMMNVRVEKTSLPTSFALHQNVPNPFNPSTKIVIDLPVLTDWKLDIYNVNGQLIQSYNGTNLGRQEIVWNAKAASGVYFYKLTAGAFTDTKKMVLMK